MIKDISKSSGALDREHLEALRSLDQFREWHSVDENRYCLVCGRIITGRQIQVTRRPRDNRPVRLGCPTQGCNSVPMDWALPTIQTLTKLDRWLRKEPMS